MKYTLDQIPTLKEALDFEAAYGENNTSGSFNLQFAKILEGSRIELENGSQYIDFTSNFFHSPLGFKESRGVGIVHKNLISWDLMPLYQAMERFLGHSHFTLVVDSNLYKLQQYIFDTLGIHKDNIVYLQDTIVDQTSHTVRFNDLTNFKSCMHHHINYFYYDPLSKKGEDLSKEFKQCLHTFQQKGRIKVITELGHYDLSRYPKQVFLQSDVILLTKGLGNGLPLSVAVLQKNAYTQEMAPTMVVDTLSPEACFNATSMIHFMVHSDFTEIHKYFYERLKNIYNRYMTVVNAWGYNNLGFIELEFPAKYLVEECFKKGILLSANNIHDVVIAPNLQCTEEELKLLFDTLEAALETLTPDCKVPLESNFSIHL